MICEHIELNLETLDNRDLAKATAMAGYVVNFITDRAHPND